GAGPNRPAARSQNRPPGRRSRPRRRSPAPALNCACAAHELASYPWWALAKASHGGLWQTGQKLAIDSGGAGCRRSNLASCPGGLAPQVLVNLRYGHRSFPDGGGDPFDRPGAYVAGGEHSWHAGFQRQRYRLARFGPVLTGQVAAGQDESVLVAPDIVGQPVGVRGGADHDEQRGGRHRLATAGGPVAQDQFGEPVVAVGGGYFSLQPHPYPRGGVDLL